MSRMLLLDVSNLVYRQYHATLGAPMNAPNGRPTGALCGTVRAVLALRRQWPAAFGAALFDGGGHRRRAYYPEYKGTRTAIPPELPWQMDAFRDWASALGWPAFRIIGEEADDLIGCLTTSQKPAEVDDVCIVSGDKDFCQLLKPGVTKLEPANTGGFQPLYAALLPDKFGVRADQIVDYLAMVGDTSDNVPGVTGVGPKGAAELLKNYGTLDHILDAPIACSRAHELVREQAAMARLSQKLVTIITDLPNLQIHADDLRLRQPDNTLLTRMAQSINAQKLLAQFKDQDDAITI